VTPKFERIEDGTASGVWSAISKMARAIEAANTAMLNFDPRIQNKNIAPAQKNGINPIKGFHAGCSIKYHADNPNIIVDVMQNQVENEIILQYFATNSRNVT
jgi:hypothetical protein